MDADKLKDLTSVKVNKNKPSARPKQAATGDYSQLYPGQQQAIDKLSDWYFSNELECTLEGYAGTGKALLNGTPVLTNKGWTSIESLKIGDLVATPYEGFQKVKGVYPQGKRPLYEITFSDGRTIICDENHLWQIRTKRMLQNYHRISGDNLRYSKTISTLDLFNDSDNLYIDKIGYKYAIPVAPIIGNHKSFNIPPYVLGILLGDGCLTTQYVNYRNQIEISSDEEDIIIKVAKLLDNANYRWHSDKNYTNIIFNGDVEIVNGKLKEYNLLCKSINKYIPTEYLESSIEQRQELLKGLMDVDGYVGQKNRFSFSTVSKQLKDDFIYLCRSLGYIVTVYEDKRDTNICYNIHILTNDIIFSSKKHLNKYNSYKSKTTKYNDHIYIKSIVKLDYESDTTCIAVEGNNKLFVTKDFIITHNTYILRYFLDNIVNKSYTVTAPTHKALRVLESQVGRKGMTLHSLHGLKPNIDLQNFDIENPQFDPLNPSKIQNYNLVVIDECSMINKDLFQLNRNRATTYNVKILYVGDSLQLPPVNEEISLTFATVKNKVVLTDIVRQEEGNPLLELFSLLRNDIKNQTNTFLNYIVRNRSNIQDGIGYEIIPRAMFNQRLIDEFNSDTFHKNIDHFRITAYTNKAVSDWNSIVRNSIVGKDADIIHINDLVLSYNTIVDEFKEPIILNSEDYILEDIRPYISDEGIKTFAVNLKSMYDGHITQPFLIVDTKDASFLKYKEILTHLYNRAANRVQHGWYVYYKFKNRFLTNLKFSIETIQGTKWINKDIDYGYSMTVHKTQGSTFDNVAIDLTDIVFQNTRFGRRENDIDIRNKLMYVALSRARKSVIMKY